MGLIQKLKSALGLDGSHSPTDGSGDVDVTVEREPSTGDEDAVKGTDTSTDEVGTSGPEVAGSVETGSETTSTPDIPDAEHDAPDVEDIAADDVGTVDGVEQAEVETGAESDDTDSESDDPVTEIKGIGPAYGERLADIGIDTVGELADADAAAVAADTDLSETRVGGWIDRARDY